MKKILISITAFLFAVQLSNAQTEKGTQTLGLNLGYSYSNSTNNYYDAANNNSQTISTTKSSSFNLGPQYSYFIENQLELGGSLLYGLSHSTDNYTTNGVANTSDKAVGKSYGGSLYLHKYFLYANKIGIRTGPYINYDYLSNTPSGPNSNDNIITTKNFNAGLGLDLVYFPSRHLGVSATLASLYYQHYSQAANITGVYTQNLVNLNFDNNGLLLAVFYVFGSK